jgi:c-di-GMP-binding flagellar brake protein YcgR
LRLSLTRIPRFHKVPTASAASANPLDHIHDLTDILFIAIFAILLPAMSSDHPAPQPSPTDRREFYRITVTLPICLQPETDVADGECTEQSVNLSAGGIGIVVTQPYRPHEILCCTLLLPGKVRFTSSLEVLRTDPIPYPLNTYRLHGRFVRLAGQDRELLIRHILQFQREHLDKHYSA